MTDTQRRYDEVPYESGAIAQAHPQHLAALAILFDVVPPDVEDCRILELGCAEGGNLIPLAADLPGSRCLGVDLSSRQVAAGEATIRETGLSNIELRHCDLMTLNRSLGEFDFILAHGVYSWVPAPVRDRLLALCQECLSEQGIAFISYNTMPGGHIRRMVREMLLYHCRRFDDVATQMREARDLLDFLIEAVPEQQAAYRQILEWERNHVRMCADHKLHHDLLADFNDPVSVADFVAQAERHQLQYVGDVDFPSMLARKFPAPIFEGLKRFSRTAIDVEQFMDFARNRVFRQTVLCRQAVPLNRQIDPARIALLHIASPVSRAEANDDSVPVYRHPNGGEIKSQDPVVQAALQVLGERWPGNVSFAELLRIARERSHSSREEGHDSTELCESLLTCFSNRLIELSSRATSCTAAVGSQPVAAALARHQARCGTVAVNLRHENVRLDETQRFVLQNLDGGTSGKEMAAKLTRTDPASVIAAVPHISTEAAETQVNQALDALAHSGFLLHD